MRRTSFPALALTAVLAAAALVGCSDDTDEPDPDPTTSAPTSEPTSAAPTDEPTAEPTDEPSNIREQELITLEEPAEGATVSGSFTASGTANSFEATVPWRVLDADGNVALEGFATADGWMDKLYPWESDVDVSSLAPGTYLFEASTSDPSDGEGDPPQVVAATIVIE